MKTAIFQILQFILVVPYFSSFAQTDTSASESEVINLYEESRSSKEDDVLSENFKKLVEESPEPDINENNLNLQLRSRVVYSLQSPLGISRNIYNGNVIKQYNRIRGNYNELSFNLLTDKDPGESSITDFTSFYIVRKNIYPFTNIIVGDFLIEFGEGLVTWNPYDFSFGRELTHKGGKHILPYSGAGESLFYRGGAADVTLGDLSISIFYSRHYLDASLDTTSGAVKTIYTDGYHRTINELNRRSRLCETSAGGRITMMPIQKLRLGLLFLQTSFDHCLNETGISRARFNYYSFSYQLIDENYRIVGESAYNSGANLLAGSLSVKFAKKSDVLVSFRKYGNNYYSLHSNAPGASPGRVEKQIAINGGFVFKQFGRLTILYEQCRFLQSTFENPFPSTDRTLYLTFVKKVSKQLEVNFKYKSTSKEIFEEENSKVSDKTVRSYKGEIIYAIFKGLNLTQRFDLVNCIQMSGKEAGFAIHQGLNYKAPGKLSLHAKIIFFQTESYNTRIYTYEYDHSGLFSNEMLYGKGTRWYLYLSFRLLERMNMSVKYSESILPFVKSIGSGWNEIPGDLESKLSMQIDYKL